MATGIDQPMDLPPEPPVYSGTDSSPGTPGDATAAAPPRGHPVMAWIVIILVVGFVTLAPLVLKEDKWSQTADSIGAVVDVGQARFLLGLRKLGMESPKEEAQLLHKFDSGPVD